MLNPNLTALLVREATDCCETRAEAASALMTAAATILWEDFGEQIAVDLMGKAIDAAAVDMRARLYQ